MIYEERSGQRTTDSMEGYLCLDFANTAEWHASEHPEEHIPTYDDLIAWARNGGVLAQQEAGSLLRKAKEHPLKAKRVYDRAIFLREAIYRIFSTVAAHKEPRTSDLDTLNATLAEALCHLRLVQSKEVFRWKWSGGEDELDRLLWPVARSAADLLTSHETNRIGECADDRGCGWLFFDMSRNRSRRWCDMKDCGNRDKARRYYARRKK